MQERAKPRLMLKAHFSLIYGHVLTRAHTSGSSVSLSHRNLLLLAAQPTGAGTPWARTWVRGGKDINPYRQRRERRQTGPGEST